MMNLHQRAYLCLIETDVELKRALVSELYKQLNNGELTIEPIELADVNVAGRPAKPELVSPREVPKRKLGSDKGKAAAIHSFCHIEFNAINLACDVAYRFQYMPREFYQDWCRVASEEAYHFGLLHDRLQQLGYQYGDFPAHNGLWVLSQKTAHDVLDRMAMIPRVMEARGLDVTPMIQKKFASVGDQDTVAILDIILRDEITHVEAGTRWFQYVCNERNLDAEPTYIELVKKYMKGDVHCPMHIDARKQAGFTNSELETLKQLCQRQ